MMELLPWALPSVLFGPALALWLDLSSRSPIFGRTL